MNERIKELSQQCWDKRLDGLHFDQEKFAELIVRDCCPQRPWVGLTDEEIEAVAKPYIEKNRSIVFWGLFYEAIEAKLKEKNT
jgi:hypothetical protein